MLDQSGKELRRMQNTLVITGSGVILMGAWTFLKMLLYLTMARNKAAEEMQLSDAHIEGLSNNTIYVSVAVIMMLFMSVFVLLRVYVGRQARAEGLGRKVRGSYLGIVFVMLIVNVASMMGILWQTVTGSYESGITDGLMAALMDLISIVVFLKLFQAASFVRKASRGEG